MIRVQTYNTSPRRLQIGGIDAGAPRGGVGNVTGTATDNVWGDILDAGKKLTGIAIQEYVKDETARVNESLLAMQKELTEERNRYMTENRGQNAIGAGQHFARFARTTAQKYLQEGKFSGRFAEMFERQAAGAALHYAEQGQNYGNQQRDIWQKSVWESSLSMAMDGASNDWGNDEYANFQRQSLYDQIDARFPGQDNRARKQEVDQSIARARMSGAIASQDFDGAEKLLGTLSGRNLSANNFGNVKNSKGGYNAYATRQDGLMGVGERVLRYSNAPDRGWHAQTIRQMVDIYAPASDNNNPAEYARFLADRIGVGPNEKVDFRDPKILAGLIKNMPVMEHGNGVQVSDEEAMAAAQSLLAGNKPKIVGRAPGKGEPALSAADRVRYREQIRAGRNRFMAEARVDIASRIQDASAAWKQGLDAPNAPTQAEIRAAYEPVAAERIWREVQAGMQFGEDMKSLGTMTGEQQMQLLERRKPSPDNAGYADQMQRYALLQQAVRQDNELRQKDPAAYLLTREPEVKQALDAFTAEPTYENAQVYVKAVRAGQEARGMSFDSTSPVLPASTATAMAQSILKSPDPVGQLQTLQSAFGISAWPAVERQLVRGNKLPGALRVAAGGMGTESGRLLMDTYKNKDFMKQATAMFDVKEADIKRDIRGEMEDFLESVNAQGDLQMGDTLVESATRLALVYMQQGYSLKDARVKAAQEVGVDRYTFKGSYRVPMQYDADVIESGASRVLNEVTSGGQLALPETRGVTDSYTRERTNAAIMQDGTWVTLPDESGLGLYVLGSPVLDKDGKHVTRTWEQLTAANEDKAGIEAFRRWQMENQ